MQRQMAEESKIWVRRFMNVAALMCASLLDLFRVKLRHGFNIASLPENHFLNDGSRLLLFMGALSAVLLFILPQ
jgi:hypothetical protein